MKKYCLAAALSMAFLAPVAKADMLLGLYVGADGWQSENSGSFYETSNDPNVKPQTFNFEDKTFTSYYAAFEHPVPLVPNIKLRYTQLELDGNTTLGDNVFVLNGETYQTGTSVSLITDFSHMDYTLYYEIFDNDLISIDFGITAKQFDGTVSARGKVQAGETVLEDQTESVDFSGFIPLGYLRGEVGLPLTGLSVFAEGNLLAIDDSKIQDYQVGIAWEVIDNLAVDIAIRAGYRSIIFELDDIDDINTDLEASGPFAGIQVHF
jgi:outer membrane protein